MGIADIFQAETKYFRKRRFTRSSKPPIDQERFTSLPAIKLSEPDLTINMNVLEAFGARRSIRKYQAKPVSESILSTVLWACQGITQERGSAALRTAPSAGALYPIDTYVVIHDVHDIERGVYYYQPKGHVLRQVRGGDYRAQTAAAAADQIFMARCSFALVWTAVYSRSSWRYHDRALRYIYLDAGHIAQNAALAATALNLGSCQVAAFYDDEVNSLVRADGDDETAVYMTAVGIPATS